MLVVFGVELLAGFRHVWMHSRGLGGKDIFAWIYAGSEVRVN